MHCSAFKARRFFLFLSHFPILLENGSFFFSPSSRTFSLLPKSAEPLFLFFYATSFHPILPQAYEERKKRATVEGDEGIEIGAATVDRFVGK